MKHLMDVMGCAMVSKWNVRVCMYASIRVYIYIYIKVDLPVYSPLPQRPV